MKNINPAVFTKKEVAHFLRVSTRTIDNLIRDGKIPTRQVRGRLMFPCKLVEEALLQNSLG